MPFKSQQIQETTQEQVQVQNLSPQQVMVARLTELSIEALAHRVENECLENPWLEKVDGTQDEADAYGAEAGGEGQDTGYDTPAADASDDYNSEGDIPAYQLQTQNGRTMETVEYGETLSFYDKLLDQMSEFELDDHQQDVLRYIIGSLEDDGLLKKPLYLIVDELAIYQGVQTSEEEVESLLHVLWHFEPTGVGARSVQECLLLQIQADQDNPQRDLMQKVITNSYDDFLHKRKEQIQQRYRLGNVEMDMLMESLLRLNPKPGTSLGESLTQGSRQITPDFLVETDQYGHVTMTLNEGNVPDLIISPDAVASLENAKLNVAAREELSFTREYVERGQLFINALAQRRQTMLKTMRAIIRIQHDFFLDGDETKLHPMKLEDIAQLTGLNVSTVSRVRNSKFVQTTYGTYPLSWFFSSKVVLDGDEVSVRKIKGALQEIISAEDKREPLSDDKLTSLLRQQGFDIARRTVAKYREQLGIPVARLRK